MHALALAAMLLEQGHRHSKFEVPKLVTHGQIELMLLKSPDSNIKAYLTRKIIGVPYNRGTIP